MSAVPILTKTNLTLPNLTLIGFTSDLPLTRNEILAFSGGRFQIA